MDRDKYICSEHPCEVSPSGGNGLSREIRRHVRGSIQRWTRITGFDRTDVGTVVLVSLRLRTYFEFRTALTEPADPRRPCPTAWLELQLFRLAWKVPGRVSDEGEYNQINRLLWARREALRQEDLETVRRSDSLALSKRATNSEDRADAARETPAPGGSDGR